MTYRQLQQLAKTLRNQGLIAKNFKLNQKATILKAAIEKATATTQAPQNQEMTQDEFNTKIAEIYTKKRKRQELEGVVVITTATMKLLSIESGIDGETFDKLFYKTPTLFTARENGKELIQLQPEYQADGTYILVA
ncbi:MAG: hypothetical protein O4804_11610 [Trichodesmium sp. St11_bin5]|nr:hypothetical protein [Trichodesmium sp. St11_bin5]